MDEYNNDDLLSQHQSDRDLWLEESIESQNDYMEYAFAVREYEYEQRKECYRRWVF